MDTLTADALAQALQEPEKSLLAKVLKTLGQERLQAVGFSPGTIGGSMGPQTQQALRWFQNTKGILATGDLDEKTLNTLEVR